jgi:hypothetical protein
MIKFIRPEVLYFLFLLIIPIIVHLFNFRRYKTLYFSNVRFLKDVQNRTKSQSRLQHLLVLLSRLLAITFLVLAFAQPYFPSEERASKGPKLVSIYLDNSFSMDAENEDGNLFELARQYALLLLDEFEENDRFFILTNNFSSSSVRPLQKEQAIDLLSEIELSPQSRDLEQIHERQWVAMESFPETDKMIFWISDFQESSFPDNLELDSLMPYKLIPVQAEREFNLSVDSVWFTDPVRRPAALEELRFRIVNHSDSEEEAVPVRLRENGGIRVSMNVDVPARSNDTYSLSFTGIDSGKVRAIVEIEDYPVQFDDKKYLDYEIRTNRSILLISDGEGSSAVRKVYQDAQFELDLVNLLAFDYSRINDYDLIILDQDGPYGSGFIEQIKNYVERGGSFLIVPPMEPDQAEEFNNLSNQLGLPILRNSVEKELKVGSIEKESAFLRGVFKRIPEQMDLPKVNKHYPLIGNSSSYYRSLLEFDNGSPFWAYRELGDGTVHLQSVPLDKEWSNWTAHALFPVIMFQLAYVTEQKTLYYTLGEQERIRIGTPDNWQDDDLPLRLVGDGSSYTLSEYRSLQNEIDIYLGQLPPEAGHYYLYKGDRELMSISFNYPAEESDLKVKEPEAIADWMVENGSFQHEILTARAENITAVLSGLNFSGGFWKWCILISLLFLLAEIVLLKVLRP